MKKILKFIFKLIVYLITPMSVHNVLLFNATALPDNGFNYQSKIKMQKHIKNGKNYHSFIGCLPRDGLVMTVII